jgi:hypothetical protein
LLTITKQRLSIGDATYDAAILRAIEKFTEVRNTSVNKKPATSEFLDWINVLKEFKLLSDNAFPTKTGQKDQYNKFRASMNVLIKSKDDIDKINL